MANERTLIPTEMTDRELATALLAIASNAQKKSPSAEERYGLIYEAACRLRRAKAAA